MSVRYHTKGFLIKKKNQGEADQLLTVYSQEFGKIKVLGRGIRKIHSKLKYGADLFNLSEIEFIQGKKVKTLTDIRVMESFSGAKKSLERLRVLSGIGNSLDLLIPREEEDEDIWELLEEVFYGLSKKISSFLIFQYFFWSLFRILGYQPSLYQCACCQEKLSPDRLYFNCQEGGVVCQKCAGEEGKQVAQETVKLLRLFSKEDLYNLTKINILKEHQKPLDKVLRDYFSYFKNTNNLLY